MTVDCITGTFYGLHSDWYLYFSSPMYLCMCTETYRRYNFMGIVYGSIANLET